MAQGITADGKNCSVPSRVLTSGEWFVDGAAIELVASSTSDGPSLLLWQDGRKPTVQRQITRARTFYAPVFMDPSIWAVMTLPTGVEDRGPAANLFGEICQLIEKYAGISTDQAAMVTAWNATSWFGDVLPNPPILFIHGEDMNAAIRLLLLLNCITRHGLLLTELSRSMFHSLMPAGPTLLLNQPQMSPGLRRLCCVANYRGLVVPGARGGVADLACAKAIFVGSAARSRDEIGLHLDLPPAPRDLPPLDAGTMLQLKEHFQPWFLHYRLRNIQAVRASQPIGSLAASAGGIGRILESCTPGGGQLKVRWARLLQIQGQDARAARFSDPLTAMVEVLWPRVHSSEKAISIKELTELANTLLRSRGQTLEYSPEELGIKLANTGILRIRRSAGMFVSFDRPNLHRLHELAQSLGWAKRMANCPVCKETRIVAGKGVQVMQAV
jgi:hypothetical protein